MGPPWWFVLDSSTSVPYKGLANLTNDKRKKSHSKLLCCCGWIPVYYFPVNENDSVHACLWLPSFTMVFLEIRTKTRSLNRVSRDETQKSVWLYHRLRFKKGSKPKNTPRATVKISLNIESRACNLTYYDRLNAIFEPTWQNTYGLGYTVFFKWVKSTTDRV